MSNMLRSLSFRRGVPALLILALFAAARCGGDEPAGYTVEQGPGDRTRYGTDTTVVVNEEGTYIVTGKPDVDCVDIGADCVPIEEATGQYCDEEGAQADIIVIDGEVSGVVCYPPDDQGTPIEEVAEGSGGSLDIPQPENGAVIVFDPETDCDPENPDQCQPIEGDITINAERTAIFGNGVDVTVIDGDLTFLSNNSRIRGVTVRGNVTYENNSNNSAAAFCTIRGNLTVHSNDFIGLDCDVFGNVQIDGNNAVLVNMGVGGDWNIEGQNPTCSGCYSIDDQDTDFVVDEPDEHGDELSCRGNDGTGP